MPDADDNVIRKLSVAVLIPRMNAGQSGWEYLVAKRIVEPHKGLWALPGGWMKEGDKSIDAAGIREVLEEVGIEVTIHSHIRSVMSDSYMCTLMRANSQGHGRNFELPDNPEPEKHTSWVWLPEIPEPRFHGLDELVQRGLL